MALLNFGNAIAGFGKAAAAMGLDSVKASLEQDKVRLAADLAAQEGILSDERKAKSATELEILRGETAATAATALADVTTARDTAAFDRSKITADNLAKASKDLALAQIKARNEGPEAEAALMNAQGAKALSAFNMANLEAQKNLQTELMAVKGTDENAEDQRLEIKSRISAQSATAATIAADRTGATAFFAAAGAELSRATQARYKAAADYVDPTNADAKAALAAAVETEQHAKSVYLGAVRNARLNIPGFKPPPVPTAVPDPAAPTAAPAPGKAAATLPDGTPITERPSTTSKALNAAGGLLNSIATAQGNAELAESSAMQESSYKAIADEINENIAGATKKGVELPDNYRRNLKTLLGTPEYKKFLSPASLALAEKFKAEDAVAEAAKKKPVPANGGKTVVRGVTITPVE
jgi:hypothetical protein